MDIVYEVCAFAGIALGLLAGAFFSTNHRDLALWSTCFALVCGLIGIFAWWQDGLWEADVRATATDPAKHDILAPIMPALRVDLAKGEPPEVDWNVKCSGPVPLNMKGVSGGTRYRDKGNDRFDRELEASKKIALNEGPDTLITPGDESGHALISSTPLTDDLYDKIMAGEKIVYAYLAVVYTDSADKFRSSTKCAYYDVRAKRFMSHRPEYQQSGTYENLRQLTIERRPSLKFHNGEMRTFAPGIAIDFIITFANEGGTVAKVYENGMHYAFIPKSDMADIQLAKLINATKIEACNYKIGATEFFDIITADKSVLTEDDVSAIKDGRSRLFIYGKIRYRDQEDGFHFNDYCIAYDGQQFLPHHVFNAVDRFGFGEHNLGE